MSDDRLSVWQHPGTRDHLPGHEVRSTHPERPARLDACLRAVRGHGGELRHRRPTPLDPSRLSMVHTAAHVERVLAVRGTQAQLDADTGVSPGSVDAALLAAGAAVAGAEAAMAGDGSRHFCLVRPPGHHAEPDRAMGFCLFSSLALAVEAALAAGATRAMVVDWDVHHGNGTQAAFLDRGDVLVMDVHQDRHYPGTGALDEVGVGAGAGKTVNVPLPAGSGDVMVEAVFRELVAPAARAFAPDLVLVAAGFDAHVDDPLGDLRVTTSGFGRLAAAVRDLADTLCDGRLVATLEGGYDLGALEGSVAACLDAWGPVARQTRSLADGGSAGPADLADLGARRIVEQVRRRHPWIPT